MSGYAKPWAYPSHDCLLPVKSDPLEYSDDTRVVEAVADPTHEKIKE
jgi:hypothetical protein